MCWCATLGWCFPLSSIVPTTGLITFLTCLIGWLFGLLSRLLYCDSIIVLERIAFPSRKDLCQSLAASDSQLAIQVVLACKPFLKAENVIRSSYPTILAFSALNILM